MISTAHRAATGYQVARALGLQWVVNRARHEIKLRSGYLQYRLPAMSWDQVPLSNSLIDRALADPDRYLHHRRHSAPPFFFSPRDRPLVAPLFEAWDHLSGGPLPLANALARGRFCYFSNMDAELGNPPDWHLNPFTGERVPSDRHWTQISDFGGGDIKVIWEPSRFRFAFDLVRAYWRDLDNRHAELYWQLLESWRAANPPNLGPNWKCGQEASLRVMAWCFALYGFLDAPATTAERVAMLGEMVAFSGCRIAETIDYALSQRNNHGISEGIGLWTIGTLFPELHDAARWRSRGRQALEALARELIYDDGSFSQHSANYHRLMLHDYLWAIRLGDIVQNPLSDELKDRFARASDLLWQIQDAETGQVPNLGANDGALVLPLSTVDFRDYRPVLQASRFLSKHLRTYTAGPWDEDLLWLFGPDSCHADSERSQPVELNAPFGGYFTIREKTGFAFFRCPARFIDRPGHADALHVDIWWRGINIARDAGSFSYNSAGPWSQALSESSVHNTVTVDGQSQMKRIGRFLWVPWLQGKLLQSGLSTESGFTYLEGAHDGYARLPAPVRHRRGIAQIGAEHWVIVDEMQSDEAHDYRLQWLLDGTSSYSIVPIGGPQNTGITMHTRAGDYHVRVGTWEGSGVLDIVRGEVGTTRGWISEHYMERTPALSLVFAVRTNRVRLWSAFGPGIHQVRCEAGLLTLNTGGFVASIKLGRGAHESLMTALTVRPLVRGLDAYAR